MHFKHKGSANGVVSCSDMPWYYIFDTKGAKEVKIRSTGYEKELVTVVICITADYNKLLPYIILSSNKTKAKNEIFPEGVIVYLPKTVDGWQLIWWSNGWETCGNDTLEICVTHQVY
jgi:hypothetical protein